MVLLDRKEEKMYEAEVSLSKNQVTKLQHVPNVQPALMACEYPEVEKMLKSHPLFQEALRKRGIVDLENVNIDVWTVGWFNEEDNPSRRSSSSRFCISTAQHRYTSSKTHVHHLSFFCIDYVDLFVFTSQTKEPIVMPVQLMDFHLSSILTNSN
jgi:Cu2+-containing amine oxidase